MNEYQKNALPYYYLTRNHVTHGMIGRLHYSLDYAHDDHINDLVCVLTIAGLDKSASHTFSRPTDAMIFVAGAEIACRKDCVRKYGKMTVTRALPYLVYVGLEGTVISNVYEAETWLEVYLDKSPLGPFFPISGNVKVVKVIPGDNRTTILVQDASQI